jgi:hypothetical protein
VEFVEHVGGESVAALHDNLVAAVRDRDLAFRGQHWLVIKVKVSVRSYATPIDSSAADRHAVTASDVGRISVADAHQHLAPWGVNRMSMVSCAIP